MTLAKLHLRDLLWLVLVVSIGCAWWVDHQRLLPPRIKVGEYLSVLIEGHRDDEAMEELEVRVTRIAKDGTLVLHGEQVIHNLAGPTLIRHVRGKVGPSDVPDGGVIHVSDVANFTSVVTELNEASVSP